MNIDQTSFVFRKQNAATPNSRLRKSASSDMNISRFTARRATTASPSFRVCRWRISTAKPFAELGDARHIAASFRAGDRPIRLHNFYVPAGGDEPDPAINPKFAHKLAFLDEFHNWTREAAFVENDTILVGDFNIAPDEQDVWSHKALLKVVSHTPIETEKLKLVLSDGPWIDALRQFTPPEKKLYTWWSYRSPDWATADKGRRLDHIWTSQSLAPALEGIEILREARGWERPSDHVPVSLVLNF